LIWEIILRDFWGAVLRDCTNVLTSAVSAFAQIPVPELGVLDIRPAQVMTDRRQSRHDVGEKIAKLNLAYEDSSGRPLRDSTSDAGAWCLRSDRNSARKKGVPTPYPTRYKDFDRCDLASLAESFNFFATFLISLPDRPKPRIRLA
jgi:hypothetical protein